MKKKKYKEENEERIKERNEEERMKARNLFT